MGQHGGFDLRFAALGREGVLPELEVFEDEVGITEQIVDRRPQGIGQGDEDPAAGHRLVALVFADGLRGNALVDGGGKRAKRQSGGPPRELES